MKVIEQIFNNHGKSIALLLIIAACFAAYSNSFNCSFQLDDNHHILNNENIKDLSNHLHPKSYLQPGFTRNLTVLTFAVNYSLGGYDVAGYHIVNFSIHVLNSFLVFGLTWLLLGVQLENRNKKLLTALFASLIFALHPVQTNAVTYIVQRLASLATLAYLAVLFFFTLARVSTVENRKRGLTWLYYGISFIFFLLGLHTKEIIATVPIAALLIELLFFSGKAKDSKFILIGVSLPLIILATLYITYYGGFPQQAKAVDRITYIATQFNVLVTYLRIFVFPINLQVFYDSQIASFSEMKTILSAVFIILIFAAGIYFTRRDKIISFSILWFFVTQIIESSIIPLQYEIFEYRLYPSLFGYALLISYLSFKLIKKNNHALIFLFIYVLMLMVGTYNRNKAWLTEESLWFDNSKKSPLNAEVLNALGVTYNKNGKYNSAIDVLGRAIEIDSTLAKAYVHRAVSFQALQDYGTALKDVDRAIKLDSTYALAFNNKGSILQNIRSNKEAITCFERAVNLQSNFHSAWHNLSIAYQSVGDFRRALFGANIAIQFQKDNGRYYNNRGNVYFGINQIDSARMDFEKTISLMPDYANGYNNLGTVYLVTRDYIKANQLFNEAIKRDPNYADPYFNRAYIFYVNNQFDFALEELKKCLLLNPYHVNAVNLYKRLHGS